MGMNELFLALGFRCTLVGSGITGIVILPVELPLEPSKLLRAVFFFSIKYASAGESLGDSYAFGIAGTGGTSSSSSLCKGLCTVVSFGAGNLEAEADTGSRG
jgi:hypothetical protein